jgi:hypothetical protein
MAARIVCLSPSGRLAPAVAQRIGAESGPARIEALSLSGYLAAPRPPRRIVLCPAGRSLPADLRFLRRVAQRLLWPPPPAGFADAIAGIRPPATAAARRSGRPTVARAPIAAALLLEGPVGPDRVRRALAAAGPRDWIVESPRSVLIPERSLARLARAGVRWSALEPVEVVGLFASPALARARARWAELLPRRSTTWVSGGR